MYDKLSAYLSVASCASADTALRMAPSVSNISGSTASLSLTVDSSVTDAVDDISHSDSVSSNEDVLKRIGCRMGSEVTSTQSVSSPP